MRMSLIETDTEMGREVDREMMILALDEARTRVGMTAPNPAVGAVLVHEGRVLVRAAHQRAGTAHAERLVLERAAELGLSRDVLASSSLYVTLEPCSTEGRTGACTRLILESGVGRVVYGSTDPYPGHGGAARGVLEAGGVEVISGVCEGACDALIRPFAKVQRRGLPWVILKTAFSLDGRTRRAAAGEAWLSGSEARRDVHRLRAEVDAVLVGGETVRCDNPALTIRDYPVPEDKVQPKRIVLTGDPEALPRVGHLFTDEYADRTRVYGVGGLEGAGGVNGLEEVLRRLVSEEGVHSVLVEAGSRMSDLFLEAGMADEWVAYVTPYLCGGPYPEDVRLTAPFSWMPRGYELGEMSLVRLGEDLRLSGLLLRHDG